VKPTPDRTYEDLTAKGAEETAEERKEVILCDLCEILCDLCG